MSEQGGLVWSSFVRWRCSIMATSLWLCWPSSCSTGRASTAIRRFSEDVSFDRTELGYTGDRDPEKDVEKVHFWNRHLKRGRQ